MSEHRMTVRGRLVRYIAEDDYRAPVDRAGQIPDFPDEDAERAWWNEHTLSEEFWRNAEPVPEDELPPMRVPEPELPPGRDLHQQAALLFFVAAGAIGAFVVYVLFRLLSG